MAEEERSFFRFTFYDMFAGIGAFHLAAEEHGGRCVGACDTDKFARQTYEANFGFEPDGDVRQIQKLPEGTDVLFAGFPCPTFSIAGKSKLRSLGRKDGLEEEERGQLIFHVERIVAASEPRPAVIVLENVKHLLHHDSGQTFSKICSLFEEHGYEERHAVLDALDFGLPQRRERVFVVLFRDGVPDGFTFPDGQDDRATLSDILDSDEEVSDKYTVGPGTWDTLERHKKYHQEQGNGFGYRLLDPEDPDEVVPTISARYHKDGAEALIRAPSRPRPRRMTPEEIARAFGFDIDGEFEFPVSDTQAYQQLGNSIAVPVATALVGSIVEALEEPRPEEQGAAADKSQVSEVTV